MADAVTAARALGLTMEVVHAATPRDIDTAFDSLTERRVGALLLGADAFYGGRIQQLVSLAARYKMLAMYYRVRPQPQDRQSPGHRRADGFLGRRRRIIE